MILLIELAEKGYSIRKMAKIAKVAKYTALYHQQIYHKTLEDEYNIKLPKNKGGYWDHKKHLQ